MSEGRVLGQTNNQIKILVAEDDNFQRLALIDILELCHYGVTALENGKLARDELMREDANYDLVLLDLMMPEMDGLELLSFMRQTDKLKDVPVIMMSSDGEMASVATCMSTGAKDYLIKPIRIQNVKGLASHVNPSQKKKNNEAKSLAQYTPLTLLGKGSAGQVKLVRSSADGLLYALKTIELKIMSPQERKLAENEVTLLKVLNGPTIIRYYESFTENETIFIVMEYAEEGSLSDRINQHKGRGEPIPNEKIIGWAAQLVIGIMLMHSKNILHRDIKSQNMFLTKGDIVKLGDFGISKALGTQGDFAKTYCGTPYFMSPEVCRDEVYNQKSDIWALGCALYELAMLRMPFDHKTMPGLMQMILEKDVDPLPDYVDPKMKMLIYWMLQKDATKRPTIWQVAQFECLKEGIMKFIADNNCKESIEGIIDFSRKAGAIPTTVEGGSEINSQAEAAIPFPMNKLDEFSGSIRDSIELKTIKTGIFGHEEKLVTGEDLFNWFNNHFKYDNLETITKVCNNMLDEGLIYSPSGTSKYEKSATHYYRFQMDRPGIAVNTIRPYKGPSRNAAQLSLDLIVKMNEVLREIRLEVSPGETGIDMSQLEKSKAYSQYEKLICELQTLQLNNLNKNELMTCFINLYQVMLVHKIIREKKTPHQPGGIFSKIKGFFRPEKDPFFYNIGQMEFNIEDIKHGILRGNKKSPNAYYYRNFADSDPRAKLGKSDDPRIVLLFNEEESLPKKLEGFAPQDLDKCVDKYCREFIATSAIYDPNENELILPKIFKIYREEFGNQTTLINFILNYYKFTNNANEVHSLLKAGKFVISYSDE
jgi:NIMA (never in mitosis gene a)-related kinase